MRAAAGHPPGASADLAARDGELARLVAACGFGGADAVVDQAMADTAATHRLVPLLGKRVFERQLAAADPALAEALIAAYRHCAIFNAAVELGLTPLGEALVRHGVPAVLLKGAALLRMVWGDTGARECGDTDVLVPADRWRDALAAVAEAGGQLVGAPRRVVTLRLFHEVHAWMRSGCAVDVHRRLHAWPLFGIDHEAVLRRATAAGDGWLLPDPVDLFVSLATHAAQDGFVVPMRYVIDALAIEARFHVPPEQVAERAIEWRARTATALWLRVLRRFGLDGEGWVTASERLDPDERTAARAAAFPLAATASAASVRWRRRVGLLRALDGMARPAVFLLARGTMFAGDLVWRLVPAPKEAE